MTEEFNMLSSTYINVPLSSISDTKYEQIRNGSVTYVLDERAWELKALTKRLTVTVHLSRNRKK